jgi:phosphoribosylaminoimidazolecarboxamide formyltransferase / IMP cyclohydrolase
MKKNTIKIKRALISVYDKTNIVSFAKSLENAGIEIISTGGTAKLLSENGVTVKKIEEITKFPEILDGRVKTLHPNIYAGILSRLNNIDDTNIIDKLSIQKIDLVVVNLYPFQKIIETTDNLNEIIENIDIGGPSMIRASAKNYDRVSIVTKIDSYQMVLDNIKLNGGLSQEDRADLAAEAYNLTSSYDGIIAGWFKKYLGNKNSENIIPEISDERVLRYGENPHQNASLHINSENGFGSIEQLQGKELSYNNINDIDASLQLIDDFKDDMPTFAIIKHTNPCGVAQRDTILDAYKSALSCDPTSAFGGILIANKTIDALTAIEIIKVFSEVIIAPDFTEDALQIFLNKKNLRIIKFNKISNDGLDKKLLKSVFGGYLVQDRDEFVIQKEDLEVVTKKKPDNKQLDDMIFAFKIAKHVKSNAIVYAKNRKTIGIGAGQTSRVDSSKIAIQKFYENLSDEKEKSGCVIASDAFFPFSDGLSTAIDFGVEAVIQPGGSIRDDEVITTANKAEITMVFTGVRHFKH